MLHPAHIRLGTPCTACFDTSVEARDLLTCIRNIKINVYQKLVVTDRRNTCMRRMIGWGEWERRIAAQGALRVVCFICFSAAHTYIYYVVVLRDDIILNSSP